MEIDINQKKLSVKDKYKIYLNGQERFFATSSMFSFMSKLQVFELDHDFPRVAIQQKWAWVKAKYTIKFEGGAEVLFRTESFWKRHFQCYVGGSAYDIYGHRGRKFSVYKDGVQIAWWEKAAVSWFNGDNYHLISDDNSDYDLLIAFCLILDQHESNHKGSNGFHVDFGNFGPQARKFDANWRPKLVPKTDPRF
ncbi:LURP-one-related/scramblase family protein [Rufibacter roseus]|uniref:Uncharacterized protein n=1 Tax=Rufibacter roseus TaxID=1567108 RepID=A0ABW2DKX6_9BACT|nr:hypothetical protein [Rufibacter roseus]